MVLIVTPPFSPLEHNTTFSTFLVYTFRRMFLQQGCFLSNAMAMTIICSTPAVMLVSCKNGTQAVKTINAQRKIVCVRLQPIHLTWQNSFYEEKSNASVIEKVFC